MENREIKFKVWDNWNKKFLDYGEVDIWDLVFAEPKLMEEIYTDGMANECLEFLQYTGLKDKNGKDIYEGDIVKLWEGTFKEHIEEIMFKNGCFGIDCYRGVTPIQEIMEEESEYVDILEVIGNIYENKELLYKII